MNWRRQTFFSCVAAVIATSGLIARAEVFDDISVTAQTLHQGETTHGYLEFRFLLENNSPKQGHEVTLVFPDRAWSSGNCIGRLERTVMLAPGARAAVQLWQPPLPVQGSPELRIETDGDRAGTIILPAGNRHLMRSGGYGGMPKTVVLVSRSLLHEEVERAFHGNRSPFAAVMATGAPDSARRAGVSPTAWLPDVSGPTPHWLELDYDPPLTADHVTVYRTSPGMFTGEITLTGASGTNLATIPMSPPPGMSRGMPPPLEITFPPTAEPVTTVRLDFGTSPTGGINIDAVEISGPSGRGWATDARASSDASSRGTSSGGSGFEARECYRAEFPVSEWSEHWLAYTPYDAIVVSGGDLKAMPPAVADAVWRYVECGGNLFVFGGGEVPKPWRACVTSFNRDNVFYAVGFGRCAVFASSKPFDVDDDLGQALLTSSDELARYWQSLPTDEAANNAFQVVENLRIPIRSMVFIMLGFVLLIGPVNIFVLSRLKRRTWMLWTIPAISFATCLLVFAYSMLREGIRPDARIESITLLDQLNRRATTLGAEAFYCPLTPSQGLLFSYDTEATPLVQLWNFESGAQHEVDWTRTQHFRRGWVTARVPAHFFLRKSETRRERLQMEGTGSQLSVVNGLAAPIRMLYLADAGGRIYTAENIAAGEKASLSPFAGTTKVSGQPDVRALLFKTGYGSRMETMTNSALANLRPGTYIATLAGSPFLENGLGDYARPERTKSVSVVYGIIDSAGGSLAAADNETAGRQ